MVVVHSTAHNVVVRIYRDRVYGVRARLYDGLNWHGVLSSRTRAGFLAVQHVRRVFALANRGLQFDTFDDSRRRVCGAERHKHPPAGCTPRTTLPFWPITACLRSRRAALPTLLRM